MLRLTILLLLCIATPGRGQEPLGNPPVHVPPQMVLDDFRAAYRKGVLAEEIVVSVRTQAGATRSDRITLRVDAAGVRTDDGPRAVLLELGPLRVWLGDGRLIATHNSERALYFERALPAPWTIQDLATLLPPLPLPQLAALDPDPEALNTPTPFTQGVRWTEGVLDPAASPPTATVSAVTANGLVSLVAGEAGRLLSFSAETGQEGAPRLTIEVWPIEPGDPASWRPATEGLEAVSSLAELRTGRAPAVLKAGDPVPNITLLASDLNAWSLHDALRGASGGVTPVEHPPMAVVVLFRPLPGAQAHARAAVDALRQISPGPSLPLIVRSAAVIDLGEFSRDAFQALRRQWAPLDPAHSSPADELLWASSPAQTIDRFSRDAGAVAAFIAHDRTLITVVILDGRASNAEALATEIRDLLRGP